MAITYGSKLTLQDNFTQVMNKAIKATEKLQKEMKELEKIKVNPKVEITVDNGSIQKVESKLEALEKNKVDIGAKLDSSFTSVMNTINRQTSVDKKIKITAEENVTRTTKNLQRDIFTMERKLKTSIFGNNRLSGSFNVSSPDWTNGFSSIVNAINSSASKNSNKNTSTGSGSSFIQDVVSNNLGTSAAMGAAGLTAGKLGGLIRASKVEVRGNQVNTGSLTAKGATEYGKPTLWKAIKGGFIDAIKDYQDYKAGMVGLREMYGGQRLSQIFDEFVSKAVPSNTRKFGMIASQKVSMAETRAKYGFSAKEYLPRYQENSLWTPALEGEEVNIFSGYTKQMNKLQRAIEPFMQKLSNVKARLKETFNNSSLGIGLSNTMAKLKDKANQLGSSMKNNLGNSFNNIKGRGELAFKHIAYTIQRMAASASYQIGRIAAPIVNVASKVKSKLGTAFSSVGAKINQATAKFGGFKSALAVVAGKASLVPGVFGKWAGPINIAGKALNTAFIKPLNTAYNGIKKLTGKTWKVAVNIAGTAFNALKQMVGYVSTLAAGFVVKGVMDAATIEQYEVSMQHFISNGMKTSQPHLTDSQRESVAKTEMENYLKVARNLANKTPFSTNEVLEAANRSIGVANGDTEQAETLLKLASDMAALTPGKSVMDAMEALADLKLGERERMKEFGFKIDNDEFVKAAGLSEGNIADLTPEQMAKAYATLTEQGGAVFEAFNGGAEKISKTFKGQFSTLLGLTGSTFADMGRMILEPLAEPLSKVNEKLLGFSNGMSELKDGVLSGEIPNPFSQWTDFKDYALENQGKGNPIVDLAAKAAPAIDKIGIIFGKVKDFMSPIIESVKNIGQSIMDFFGSPAVQGALEVWGGLIANVCQTAFDWLDKVFRFIADNAEPIGNFLSYIGEWFTLAWEMVSGAVETAWVIVEPILSLLMDWLGKIYDFLSQKFATAGDFVKQFWDGCKGTLQSIVDKFKEVTDAIGGAISKASEWAGQKISSGINAVKDFFGGDDYNNNGRAVGQAYVPYNGYKASLHKGEAILTAQEARAWREDRVGGGSSANTSMSVNINVYEATNAKATANEIVRQLRRVAPNMA